MTAHWDHLENRKILMLVSTARESRLESLKVGVFKSPSGDSNVRITGKENQSRISLGKHASNDHRSACTIIFQNPVL